MGITERPDEIWVRVPGRPLVRESLWGDPLGEVWFVSS